MIVPIMTYERSTLVKSEKYIGLDVHQATISVAVMDSRGKVVMESILETKAATILEFFAGMRGILSVTFEEGTWAAWLYDLLKPHVAKLVVCNPRKNALLKHGNKSDRIDARKLADAPRSRRFSELARRRFSGICEVSSAGANIQTSRDEQVPYISSPVSRPCCTECRSGPACRAVNRALARPDLSGIAALLRAIVSNGKVSCAMANVSFCSQGSSLTRACKHGGRPEKLLLAV